MKRSNILTFVGADRCGKTHIAHEISSRLSLPYFKASGEHGDFLKSQDRFVMATRYADPRLLDFLKQTGYGAIFDRGYPCEAVYSKFFGREAEHGMLQWLDEEYSKLGMIIVFCYRKSFEGIADDLDPKRLNSEALQQITDLYWDFLKNKTKCRWISVAVDDENLDREVKEILEQL